MPSVKLDVASQNRWRQSSPLLLVIGQLFNYWVWYKLNRFIVYISKSKNAKLGSLAFYTKYKRKIFR